MEELDQTVVMEITTPEVIPEEMTPAQEAPAPVDEKAERNWREMRRKNAELEQKARMQEELLAQMLRSQQAQQPQQVDELASIGAEEYIPKGQVERLVEKKAQALAEQVVERKLKENERAQFHQRLTAKFPDFDDVVTTETLELLDKTEPELAHTMAQVGDPYLAGLQAYKYIKASGLLSKAPDLKRTKEVDAKLEKNAKTVQTPQAYEKRPMAQTFQLTDAMKQELYKEMMVSAQRAG